MAVLASAEGISTRMRDPHGAHVPTAEHEEFEMTNENATSPPQLGQLVGLLIQGHLPQEVDAHLVCCRAEADALSAHQ